MARGIKIVGAADSAVIETRRSLAQRIAAYTEKEGEHTSAVPGLILYHLRRRLPAIEPPMNRVSASLCRDESGSISEVRSICAMDRRSCCRRSMCLHKARS